MLLHIPGAHLSRSCRATPLPCTCQAPAMLLSCSYRTHAPFLSCICHDLVITPSRSCHASVIFLSRACRAPVKLQGASHDSVKLLWRFCDALCQNLGLRLRCSCPASLCGAAPSRRSTLAAQHLPRRKSLVEPSRGCATPSRRGTFVAQHPSTLAPS